MPNYSNDIYDIEKAFKAIENELMSSMMRNMQRHRDWEDDEGFKWSQWQTEQLKALEKYKRNNRKKFTNKFSDINKQIDSIISSARNQGGMDQEIAILKAIKEGKLSKRLGKSINTSGEFFRLNTEKMEALIKATKDDFAVAEFAMLRQAEDQYRQVIFNAEMYANSGAGTYAKAVDMATKDFIARGITCIEYKNGARHTMADYASMCLRTASKRAYFTGEGEKRQQWGRHLVILNKRGNACPLCLPFIGKVLIDDVWSGGSKDDGNYPLMSEAMKSGLYHPNCKDGHTTYFPELDDLNQSYSKNELQTIQEDYKNEQQGKFAERQADKFGRLAEHSMDPANKRMYQVRADEWKDKAVDDIQKSDILYNTSTKEVVNVHSVGKIDRKIYKCITDDIVTDEVVITDKQIQHIMDRHPNDYERYEQYLRKIVETPDYIIEASKPNTALILKEIKENGEVFKTVLRIATSNEPKSYKNSIITFMKIDDKEWNRLLRNKKILYKKE